MKILIHGLNYAPELTGIGKYTGEMAEWLAARGHEVRVVTAPPYYPMWRVGEGYSAWRYAMEVLGVSLTPTLSRERGGRIRVYRCPLWVPQRLSGIKRLLHHLSFTVSSLPVVLWQGLFWRPDVVWVVAPSLLSGPGGWLAARLGAARAWLHIQDFELDAAFGLGLLKTHWLRGIATTLERWLMRRFDRVSTISERMLNRLITKGVASSQCVLFLNWVNTDSIFPLPKQSPMRKELGISEDTVVALYSGNMGEKQGLEILVEVARTLSGHQDLLFVLCGDGAVRMRLHKLTEGFPNVLFLLLQPVERLNELLNLADIHLLLQRADAADLVLPSKLTGMMASGRPVIATTHPDTEIARIVENCGLIVPPGDGTALARAIMHLAAHSEDRVMLGQAARLFAVTQWARDEILGRFEKTLGLIPWSDRDWPKCHSDRR